MNQDDGILTVRAPGGKDAGGQVMEMGDGESLLARVLPATGADPPMHRLAPDEARPTPEGIS